MSFYKKYNVQIALYSLVLILTLLLLVSIVTVKTSQSKQYDINGINDVEYALPQLDLETYNKLEMKAL